MFRNKDYNKKLNKVNQKKELYDKKIEIKQIRASMRRRKPLTTTKLLMAFIFINCTVVEAYSMWIMWALMDLSSLYALITAVITESLSFAIYAAKAYNETKQEEIIKLERDKMNYDLEPNREGAMG